MREGVGPRRAHQLLLPALVAMLVAGGAQAANAHRTGLSVEIVSEQARIAPDGSSMSLSIRTECDMKWTIEDARVTVVQGQAWGEASYTPRCARLPYGLSVTVPALQGTFQTGATEASALLVVRQGKTKEARDSALIRARPSVSVSLTDRATLDGGGEVVHIDVTVTCPMTSTGRGGEVRVYDGRVVGTGRFGPSPCDAQPHTLSVSVETSEGAFQPGSAEAFAFVGIEEGGDIFQGADLRTVQLT